MNGMTTFVEPATKQERRERRVKLERDRDVVRAQLTELRQRLPGLQKSPSLGPSKQGGVSKKRPAANLADLTEDVKRQKVETERIRRVNSIWQQCQTIVKTLLKSKDSFAFSKPVNPVTAKCPDYHDIIKRPMDLGTIQKKFPGKGKANEKRPELREYRSPYEFRDDVRLVWANCRTYNAVGHAVRTMGDTMSEMWEKKWALSGIEAKWEDELHRQSLEEQELSGTPNIAQQIQSLDASLQQHVKQTESLPGYRASDEGTAMSFEQKRRLSIALGQLPGDEIANIMRIMAEDKSMQNKVDSTEEVEVDIDQLSTDILWKLERYASNVLQASRRKASLKPNSTAAEPAQAIDHNQGANMPDSQDHQAALQSSSTSSSESGSEPSNSASEGEVGSKELEASQGDRKGQAHAQRVGEGGNDAATLVSATRPPGQPHIVKTMASKKDVTLQNANAWADLRNTKVDEPNDGGEEGEAEDGLWDEFKSREQEEEQREKEKLDEVARHQREQQRAEEAARAEAEKLRKEAEEEEQAQKSKEEARINAQREKELEEMQKVSKGADFAAGGVELMQSERHNNTLSDVLGLQRKASDSDNDSDLDE